MTTTHYMRIVEKVSSEGDMSYRVSVGGSKWKLVAHVDSLLTAENLVAAMATAKANMSMCEQTSYLIRSHGHTVHTTHPPTITAGRAALLA